MSLVATAADLWWPMAPFSAHGSAPPATGTLGTNNGAALRTAIVLRVPYTGTLHSFEFLSGTYSGTNTPRMSFQDVDVTTGNPDGGVDQYRLPTGASSTWIVPTGPLTSDGTDTGTKRTVTAGDIIACVLDFSAWTNGSWAWNGMTRSAQNRVIPFHATYNGVAWTKNATPNYPSLALRYSSPDSYILVPESMIYSALTNTSFNSGSAADEYAAKFVLPFRCVVDGAWFGCDWDEAIDVVLYNNAGSAAATISCDKDIRNAANHAFAEVSFEPVTIAAGDTVRLAVKPTTVTNVAISTRTIPSSAASVTRGGSASGWQSTRVDGGAWTDSSTLKMWAGLHISQVDDGTGATGFAGLARRRLLLGH